MLKLVHDNLPGVKRHKCLQTALHWQSRPHLTACQSTSRDCGRWHYNLKYLGQWCRMPIQRWDSKKCRVFQVRNISSKSAQAAHIKEQWEANIGVPWGPVSKLSMSNTRTSPKTSPMFLNVQRILLNPFYWSIRVSVSCQSPKWKDLPEGLERS